MTPDISPTWARLIDEFIQTQSARGLSTATIATRRGHLQFLARTIEFEATEITGERLIAWSSRPAARATRRSYRVTLQQFWRWGAKQGALPVDAGAELERIPPVQPKPRPTPDDIYSAALAAAKPRVHLMLRLAALLGLRRGEIARVHSSDLTFDVVGWSLIVTGKGDKQRTIPCPPGLAQEIAAANGHVFPGRIDGHLSARQVGDLMSAALPGTWTAHSLRHRAGTRWYSIDRDAFTVQQLLGHASPVTTRHYVRLPDDALRRTVLAAAAA